ncbi:MAG: polynucleotide kinase-phosphatase [Candidatus Protochlamydia sp.]|nr:polynucleotide kinase-phosphatase [Candidatus Protochlamydia sp.]
MRMQIPNLSIVVLVGPSGSGKSSFARKHFKPTEVISSDFCRGLVSDDENNQGCSKDAFDVMYYIAAKRLAAGKLVVIDATNVQKELRQNLLKLAKQYHCIPVAIVCNIKEKICLARNTQRSDRFLKEEVIRNQVQQLKQSLRSLKMEGFRHIYFMDTPEEMDEASVERVRLWNDLKDKHGPFDIIGDVHGCYDELLALLAQLGYIAEGSKITQPTNRKVIFLGDLVDRGPKTPEVVELVMDMVDAGCALCVPGNHDIKLVKKLEGKNVKIAHGMEHSLEQLQGKSPEFIERMMRFFDNLVSHYVLDDGKLVVAHAGLKEEFHGRGSGAVRAFALFGAVSGELEEDGTPIRDPWFQDYRGNAMVVYGHTSVLEPQWINNTIDIDTGCVFGGKLTALQYPEKNLVSVSAHKQYAVPTRPLRMLQEVEEAEKRSTMLLDIRDVQGSRVIQLQHYRPVTIKEENTPAALEFFSRFAIDPRWVIYLPPTMAPTKTSSLENYLEYPSDAFSYFKSTGTDKVICEKKHMGSRAVVVLCKDLEAAKRKFGDHRRLGVCYTRSGRAFFNDEGLEAAFLERMHINVTNANLWNELQTDWICLDCEIMPWSAKAQSLVREQYAAVGAASLHSLAAVNSALASTNLTELQEHYQRRLTAVQNYAKAYKPYCWPVSSIADYRIAPFHLLASEGAVHCKKNHIWHLNLLKSLCVSDPDWFEMTEHLVVDINDSVQCEKACAWWLDLTEQGHEGMVVKPLDFMVKRGNDLLQPGIKVRGREYLRLIYGPEYTLPEHLQRLKQRNVGRKSSLALREFALGLEALERFAANEPLYRVHECVFAILALENEPIDPRL